MEKIIISAEATCDLPRDIIEENDIRIVDMDFLIDGTVYNTATDDVLSTNLYGRMRRWAKTSTSQVNEIAYQEHFEMLLRKGYTVIHLALSSGLSGTYYTAVKAAAGLNQCYDNKVYVIDSLCGCSGQGYLAVLANQFAKTADNIDQVLQFIEKTKHNINHYFTVDNLKYLSNSGRIKTGIAIIGNVLNIKPVMRMDESGSIVAVKKVISRKKSLQALYDKFVQSVSPDCKMVYISHSDCYNDAEYVFNQIKVNYPDINVVITNLGPVVGSHSGPGTVAIYFLSDNGR